MATVDEQIGANLAEYRGDMSQQTLAEIMRGLGWKWSQATVWSIEKGERPLRLAEAQATANILGIPLHDLVRSAGGAQVAKYQQRMREAGHEILGGAEKMTRLQVELSSNANALWALSEAERSEVEEMLALDPVHWAHAGIEYATEGWKIEERGADLVVASATVAFDQGLLKRVVEARRAVASDG